MRFVHYLLIQKGKVKNLRERNWKKRKRRSKSSIKVGIKEETVPLNCPVTFDLFLFLKVKKLFERWESVWIGTSNKKNMKKQRNNNKPQFFLFNDISLDCVGITTYFLMTLIYFLHHPPFSAFLAYLNEPLKKFSCANYFYSSGFVW